MAQLQELWIQQKFQLGTSLGIMKEVSKAIVARDDFQTDRIIDDPTDNKFLACALEVKADYIVSGDNHLLSIKHFHGTQIVAAKAFITKVTEQ